MKQNPEITHKEAVIKSLEMLGGKAQLKQIYPVAIKLIGKNTTAKDIKAIIRREINSNPLIFKSAGEKDGTWELLSYQEELAKKNQEISVLKDKLLIKEQYLKSLKTEDDFIKRLLRKLKTIWKDDKKTIGEIRKILDSLGRPDVVEEIDAFMERRTKRTKKQNELNNIIVNGDFVTNKHVGNEVCGVATGATGINMNK
jgi:hypothetical protein